MAARVQSDHGKTALSWCPLLLSAKIVLNGTPRSSVFLMFMMCTNRATTWQKPAKHARTEKRPDAHTGCCWAEKENQRKSAAALVVPQPTTIHGRGTIESQDCGRPARSWAFQVEKVMFMQNYSRSYHEIERPGTTMTTMTHRKAAC